MVKSLLLYLNSVLFSLRFYFILFDRCANRLEESQFTTNIYVLLFLIPLCVINSSS